jgi:transglutaminase-like putative cysteine protease
MGTTEMSKGEKLGIGLALGGVVLAVGGYWYYRRSKTSQFGQFGYAAPLPTMIESHKANGMTVRHYYDRKMPIQKRVSILQKLVEDSVKDPEMRKLALGLTRNCPPRDDKCEMRAIYNAVKQRVRYTGDVAPIKHSNGDVEGVDYFQTAKRTWEIGGGDCDDQAVLNATLLSLNGIPARFRITAPRGSGGFVSGDDGGGWSHIYAIGLTPRNHPTSTVAMDTTIPGDYFGREAPYGKHIDFVV